MTPKVVPLFSRPEIREIMLQNNRNTGNETSLLNNLPSIPDTVEKLYPPSPSIPETVDLLLKRVHYLEETVYNLEKRVKIWRQYD